MHVHIKHTTMSENQRGENIKNVVLKVTEVFREITSFEIEFRLIVDAYHIDT